MRNKLNNFISIYIYNDNSRYNVKYKSNFIKFSIALKSIILCLFLSAFSFSPAVTADGWETTDENTENVGVGGSGGSGYAGSSEGPVASPKGYWGTVSDVSTNSPRSSNSSNGSFFNSASEGCCPKGPIGLILDKDYSPIVGSSALNSLVNAYMTIDDRVYPNSQGDTNSYMIFGRFVKTALEDVAFSTGMVTQHEIFGHGWRAREFDVNVNKYKIQPYKGSTLIDQAKFNTLSPSERIAVIAGGMEATSILAQQIRNRWLESKFIDEREGHFYLNNILDQTFNVWRIRNSRILGVSDVSLYIQQINNWYGRTVLTHKQLARREVFDLFDPYLWYSVYGLSNYLYDGTQCFEYPMIPFGEYRYLPGFRVALAPYGPEYLFINYLRAMDYTIQATFRYGSTGGKDSEGLILEMSRLWAEECLSFDGRVDLWSQPRLFVEESHQADRKLGGAVLLTGRYRFLPNFEMMGQLGYKMKGYMPGEGLNRGIIFRWGLFVYM